MPSYYTPRYGIGTIHYEDNQVGVYYHVDPVLYNGYTEVVSGPRRVKPAGAWVAPTSSSFSYQKWQYSKGFAQVITTYDPPSTLVDKKTYNGCFGGSWNELSTPFPDNGATYKALAVNAALLQAKNQKINLAQAFAERDQVCRLFEDTARRVAQAFTELRRRNLAGALRAFGYGGAKRRLSTKDIGQQWLEIQYGWKPLLSDLYGAVDVLRKRDEDSQRYRFSVQGHAGAGGSNKPTQRKFNYADGPYLQAYVLQDDNDSAFCRLDFCVDSGFRVSCKELGISDPLSLAWELLPWSFVVDWFAPIGSFLQGFNATGGLTYMGGSVSFRRRVHSTCEWKPRPDLPHGTKVICNQQGEHQEVLVDRQALVVCPMPTLIFKNPLSAPHVENALALLRGVFRR